MVQARERLLELLFHLKNKKSYKKRSEICLELVKTIESEDNYPAANYAFDNGVLTKELTKYIESKGKHWVSEIECSRNINWNGNWIRVDSLDEKLKEESPESFRKIRLKVRNGDIKDYMVFTKVVRLKKFGRKRLVIVHESLDLTDKARYLLTDANHWEPKKIIETWSYRWDCEIFHEFSKQATGLEASQVRNEEAVKRHFRLSCVSQSLIQRVPAVASKSEKFKFAKENITFGQKVRTIARESFFAVINLVESLVKQGKSSKQILEVVFPT
jgi:hypothetical protein